MGQKHDNIVLSLTDEKLKLLLSTHFGEKRTPKELITVGMSGYPQEDKYLMRIAAIREQNLIKKISVDQGLDIRKKNEFCLVKGKGQYMITKGFIDLIVHCKPAVSEQGRSCYSQTQAREFIIEIKTEADFVDVGDILRQINEYKVYYEGDGIQKWESEIIPNNYSGTERTYCVLSTKIPEKAKEFLSNEQIVCLETG